MSCCKLNIHNNHTEWLNLVVRVVRISEYLIRKFMSKNKRGIERRTQTEEVVNRSIALRDTLGIIVCYFIVKVLCTSLCKQTAEYWIITSISGVEKPSCTIFYTIVTTRSYFTQTWYFYEFHQRRKLEKRCQILIKDNGGCTHRTNYCFEDEMRGHSDHQEDEYQGKYQELGFWVFIWWSSS